MTDERFNHWLQSYGQSTVCPNCGVTPPEGYENYYSLETAPGYLVNCPNCVCSYPISEEDLLLMLGGTGDKEVSVEANDPEAFDSGEKNVWNTEMEIIFNSIHDVKQTYDKRCSGQVFIGVLRVPNHFEMAIQTGGHRANGAALPVGLHVDTGCPIGRFTMNMAIDTELRDKDGKIIRHEGYKMQTPGTGRTAIKIHKSNRHGSEGCPSVRSIDNWIKFRDFMERVYDSAPEEEKKKGVIPIKVSYTDDVFPRLNQIPPFAIPVN